MTDKNKKEKEKTLDRLDPRQSGTSVEGQREGGEDDRGKDRHTGLSLRQRRGRTGRELSTNDRTPIGLTTSAGLVNGENNRQRGFQ